MPLLFQAYNLRNQQLRNRIVVAPMCQYSSKNGYAQDWHLVHLGQYALGGAGAIIQEATAVSPEGRITYADLGIWENGQIEKLQQITSFIKQHGGVPGIQLAHAGRKASTEKPWISRSQIAPNTKNGWQAIGPSANGFHPKDHPAIAMSLEDIESLKKTLYRRLNVRLKQAMRLSNCMLRMAICYISFYLHWSTNAPIIMVEVLKIAFD